MRLVLMYSTHEPSGGHVDRLRTIAPAIDAVIARDEPHAIEAVRDAEVILGHRYLRQSLPTASRLRFVQSTAGGVDRLPLDAMARQGVRLARMTTASPTIARHAVTLAWAVTRRLPEARDRQHQRAWQNGFDWPPMPRTALVIGTGSIGRALAELLKREGMTVLGVRGSEPAPPVAGFDETHGPSALPSLLPRAGWCFLATPLTPRTEGMIDEAALRALPETAVLVNVARGETLDTDALVRVLREGHLAGAALDVLPTACKADDHPVWSAPRVLITPHVSSHAAERPAEIERFAEAQVRRYIRGNALVDEVELAAMRTYAA